jgi:dihydrofolate reductase
MHATVYIATSLDGFIARKDGSIDWLHSIQDPPGEDYGYAEFISRIDAIVMGRVTFETVLGFKGEWPYPKPVYVLSSTLRRLPDGLEGKAVLLDLPLVQALARIARDGHQRFYVDGGKTIQRFLREDLIDRLIVTKIPILLGEGIPLFGPIGRDLVWTHLRTTPFANGLVKSEYERRRA